jgi:CheY-like chemotaxis protein
MSGGSRIGSFDYLEIAERLGADAVLPKPFTREQFLSALVTASD